MAQEPASWMRTITREAARALSRPCRRLRWPVSHRGRCRATAGADRSRHDREGERQAQHSSRQRHSKIASGRTRTIAIDGVRQLKPSATRPGSVRRRTASDPSRRHMTSPVAPIGTTRPTTSSASTAIRPKAPRSCRSGCSRCVSSTLVGSAATNCTTTQSPGAAPIPRQRRQAPAVRLAAGNPDRRTGRKRWPGLGAD